MRHDFPFDPTYGYDREALLAIEAPPTVDGFAEFWRATFDDNAAVPLRLERGETVAPRPGLRLSEIRFDTLGGVRVGAWLLEPEGPVERGIVVGHGYGGRQAPELDLPLDNAAAVFPCAPGFDLSAAAGLPDTAARHVVHGIDSTEAYILRPCVASLWSAATALLQLYPQIGAELYFSGGSFGGGLGALALPWDGRFKRGNLGVPTFGHHAIRLQCRCTGSGESVRAYHRAHPEVVEVLAYYDAAVAAGYARSPAFFAPALFDPAVPPPGQFAVYNAWAGEKELFVLAAGHFEYGGQEEAERVRGEALRAFFTAG